MVSQSRSEGADIASLFEDVEQVIESAPRDWKKILRVGALILVVLTYCVIEIYKVAK